MVVTREEIGLFYSGGTNNEEPDASLGGQISTHQIVDDGMNNLWPDVSGFDAQIGIIGHRLLYIKNLNETDTFGTVKAWISQQNSFTESAGTTVIGIGVATAGLDNTEAAIANSETPPPGVVFTDVAKTEATAIQFGNIPPLHFFGIWIRRTILSGAEQSPNDYYNLRIQGKETTTL